MHKGMAITIKGMAAMRLTTVAIIMAQGMRTDMTGDIITARVTMHIAVIMLQDLTTRVTEDIITLRHQGPVQ